MNTRDAIARLLLLAATCSVAHPASGNSLVNPSFEDGETGPAVWRFDGSEGAWASPGRTGDRCVTVGGSGDTSWSTGYQPFGGDQVVRLTSHWKAAAGGNRGSLFLDLGFLTREFRLKRWYDSLPIDWEQDSMIVRTPRDTREGKLGLGSKYGIERTVSIDDVSIHRITPVHARRGGLPLGADEYVEKGRYAFLPNLDTPRTNYSRPLVDYSATFEGYFHTGGGPSRWRFDHAGQFITYRHQAGPRQENGSFEIHLIGFNEGHAVVEAGRDGENWTEVGRFSGNGPHGGELPRDLFPAETIWIRIRSEGSFTMYTSAYEADLAGSPPDRIGGTCFLEENAAGRLNVKVRSVGEMVPGGDNRIQIRLGNPGASSLNLQVKHAVHPAGPADSVPARPIQIDAGRREEVDLEYAVQRAGEHHLSLSVVDAESGETLYEADGSFTVPPLPAMDYGYALGVTSDLDPWWCEGTYKVGRDRLPPSGPPRSIQIAAARHEYEPFQVVLRPKREMKNVFATCSGLASGNGFVIGREHLQIDLVHYKRVKFPDDALGCAGDWPDALPPFREPVDLPAEENQPMWFTVYVPEEAPAGAYRGTIRVQADGMDPLEIPVHLTVWDFTLPRETHTRTQFGLWMNSVMPYTHAARNQEERDRVHMLYLENMAAHRVAPAAHHYNLFNMIDIKPRGDGVFDLDFDKVDRYCRRALDDLHLNTLCAGWHSDTRAPLGRPGAQSFGERGFEAFEPEYVRNFTSVYGRLTEHLRVNGWLDRIYFYLFDEPFAGERYTNVRVAGKPLHDACPGLPGLVTVQFEPSLYGSVDIWCPLTSHFDLQRAAERRQVGDEIWWYVATGPRYPYPNNLIDHPAMNQRIHFWMMQKYDIRGTLYWAVNYYRGMDPPGKQREFVNPWEQSMCGSPDGGFHGNGDGVLLYPPRREPVARPLDTEPEDKTGAFYDPHNACWFSGGDPVLEPPINSIRWEMVREGLEDREYFWVLEQELERVKQADTSPALQRAIEDATHALAASGRLVTSLTEFESDPLKLYEARRQLARAIESLRAMTRE